MPSVMPTVCLFTVVRTIFREENKKLNNKLKNLPVVCDLNLNYLKPKLPSEISGFSS